MSRKVTGANDASDAREVAGIYCRLSLARYGDTTKVDDQERICRSLAIARGWYVPEEFVYKDNNESAWKRNRKRPGWDRMLADIGAGRFRNLVVYHGDRLVRHPADLEVLLNLADRGGMTITSPSGRRNLDVGSDRTMMRVEVAFAWQASDDTSRRKKDGFRRMALKGIAPTPGGRSGRGFGYARDGRTPVAAEAQAIRAAAARLLAGDPITAIARDLAADGVVSTSGQPLTYQSLNRILTRPRIAGLLGDGTPGSWEPILDRETWEMVGGVLRARAAALGRTGGQSRYLLSGIAKCGLCGSGLQRQSAGRRGNLSIDYGCVAAGCRKIHRNMEYLDTYVTAAAVAKLDSPELARALARVSSDPFGAQIAQLEKRRNETRAQAGRLAEEPGADLEMLSRAVASFTRKIAELRAAATEDVSRRTIRAHTGISYGEFAALPLHKRRAIVAALFTVIVLPVTRRGPGFDTSAVRLLPPGARSDRI